MLDESRPARPDARTLLAPSLASCLLAEGHGALDVLQRLGVRVTQRASALRAVDLIQAYQRRWRFLDRFDSDFANRLRFAVGELIARLQFHHRETVDLFDIHSTREEYYLIFRLCAAGKVIGCLPMVDRLKVSPERWRQLWESLE